MNKIVELLIDLEDEILDGVGVNIMSLVDRPAIGVNWMAFSEQHFVMPSPGEEHDPFMGRCIAKLVGDEGYPQDQAAAICHAYWEEKHGPTEMGIDTGGLEPYVDQGDKPLKKEFASYTDYPKAARENAQRALDWAEENGWGDCGTPVGKTRANQLAKGEPISEETIARMAAFARHEQNSKTPYGEGCGKLMWDAWGGSEGINWAQRKLESIREEKLQREILKAAEELGEEYDPSNTLYIDITKDEFTTVGEVLEGIVSLDILGKNDIRRNQEAELKYRYAGPSAQRSFCRGMLRLNKLYTREEINEITRRTSALNPGMGHNSSTYSVWNYKGGVNCKHYWEELHVFRNSSGSLIMVSNGPAPGNAGEVASASNNYWRFKADDDQMIVTGPAMIPQQLIPRKDELGNMFHVFFSKETIAKIAEQFLKHNMAHNTDINHDELVSNENTLLESWIVDDPEADKSKSLGYNVPKGTWMVSYKINNPETWNKIKTGELNGFSVSGEFLQKLAN